MTNSESLITPQECSKPDLPSLESVVTHSIDAGYYASSHSLVLWAICMVKGSLSLRLYLLLLLTVCARCHNPPSVATEFCSEQLTGMSQGIRIFGLGSKAAEAEEGL